MRRKQWARAAAAPCGASLGPPRVGLANWCRRGAAALEVNKSQGKKLVVRQRARDCLSRSRDVVFMQNQRAVGRRTRMFCPPKALKFIGAAPEMELESAGPCSGLCGARGPEQGLILGKLKAGASRAHRSGRAVKLSAGRGMPAAIIMRASGTNSTGSAATAAPAPPPALTQSARDAPATRGARSSLFPRPAPSRGQQNMAPPSRLAMAARGPVVANCGPHSSRWQESGPSWSRLRCCCRCLSSPASGGVWQECGPRTPLRAGCILLLATPHTHTPDRTGPEQTTRAAPRSRPLNDDVPRGPTGTARPASRHSNRRWSSDALPAAAADSK